MGTIWRPELNFQGTSKYAALIDALKADIISGVLAAGEKLPPVRELAYQLSITPGTVARAYKEAIAAGYLQATTGRGTFVAEQSCEQTQDEWDGPLDLKNSDTTDVGQDRIIADCLMAVAERNRSAIVKYPSRRGTEPVYELVAGYLKTFGVSAEPTQITLTHGGQNAIVLATLSMQQEGSVATGIDALTYPGIRQGLLLQNTPVFQIAIDQEGMVPYALEEACKVHKLGAIVTSANVLNPTVGRMGLERRREIVKIARKYDLQIIEDDCWGLVPSDLPSFQVMCPERGWYLSSISKGVAAGLRLGFLVAPEKYRKTVSYNMRYASYGVSNLLVDLLEELLRSGRAETVSSLVQKKIAERVELTVNRLGAWNISWRRDVPFIWLKLPRGWRSSSFSAACERQGVLVRAADEFALQDARVPSAVRVAVNCNVPEPQFIEALDTISDLLHSPPIETGS